MPPKVGTLEGKCVTCTFYDARATFCRRFPPTSHPVATPSGVAATSLWPPVSGGDWCGEYVADPLVQIRPSGDA